MVHGPAGAVVVVAPVVVDVARRYFARENLTVVAVGQRKGIKALEKVVETTEGLPSAT